MTDTRIVSPVLIVELMTSEVMKELCLMVSVLRGRMSDFDSHHNNHISLLKRRELEGGGLDLNRIRQERPVLLFLNHKDSFSLTGDLLER